MQILYSFFNESLLLINLLYVNLKKQINKIKTKQPEPMYALLPEKNIERVPQQSRKE